MVCDLKAVPILETETGKYTIIWFGLDINNFEIRLSRVYEMRDIDYYKKWINFFLLLGENDPATGILPQQPLHKCMFPQVMIDTAIVIRDQK